MPATAPKGKFWTLQENLSCLSGLWVLWTSKLAAYHSRYEGEFTSLVGKRWISILSSTPVFISPSDCFSFPLYIYFYLVSTIRKSTWIGTIRQFHLLCRDAFARRGPRQGASHHITFCRPVVFLSCIEQWLTPTVTLLPPRSVINVLMTTRLTFKINDTW